MNGENTMADQVTKTPKTPFWKKDKEPKAPKTPKVKEAKVKEPKVKEPKVKLPKEDKPKTKLSKDSLINGAKSVVSKVKMPFKKNTDFDEAEVKPVKIPKVMLFSIRNKIIACFSVPVLFMIIIGISSYNKAATGMSDKFKETTVQTVQKGAEYIDLGCTLIEPEGVGYASDKTIGQYFLGMLDKDAGAMANTSSQTRLKLSTAQRNNPFTQDISIIPKSGKNMISTAMSTPGPGIMQEHLDSMEMSAKNMQKWIDKHPVIDEALGTSPDEYIMSFQMISTTMNYMVVVDVASEAIQEALDSLYFGEGSVVGFVTDGGRELFSENLAEGQESKLTEGESVFLGQEFYETVKAGEETLGTFTVKYKGKDHFFIYSKCEGIPAMLCALVPENLVTGQADAIKTLTISLVVLAIAIAVVIGVLTVIGIQGNMKRISRRLDEVAKGDLTVNVRAKGRDEFQKLAASATHMVSNTKKLVDKVSNATDQLEVSSRDVEQASGVIDEYSKDITQAIQEINEGMSRQSRHAQECVAKTDTLSEEIQTVSRVIENVEALVEETEGMINQGMEIVHLLGNRADETTEITEKVGDSIENLRQETLVINTFVSTITDISEQTNLLSLNASIEAARAGDAGRGFAVVAEEIRKLADDSAKAAGEIGRNVEHITAQTLNSVQSAKQAQDMVALQAESVEQVVSVFRDMQGRMAQLVDGLKEIVVAMERADRERGDTVEAVKNISDIIEETASSAESVNEVASKLLKNVENLNHTAETLSENMDDLKTEISGFKI